MTARRLLDTDMATLGRWLSQGLRSWLDELEQLLPARSRQGHGRGLPEFLFADNAASLVARGTTRARLRAGERVAVILPRSACLARVIERPVLNDRDLQRMAAFEGESLLPFPSGLTLVAARRLGPGTEPARMHVQIAGLPMAVAQTLAELLAQANLTAARVQVEDDDLSAPRLDFAPAMREAGLIASPRSAAPMAWALVGFLVLLNGGLVIWKDMQAVDRLEQIVESQQPAVAVAQTIRRRIARDQELVATSLALRRDHDALGGLVAVSRALPGGAWLQRYGWDGETVKLTGYRPPRSDVAGELRRSGSFADVRVVTDEVQAAVPAGEPFDIGARIVRR